MNTQLERSPAVLAGASLDSARRMEQFTGSVTRLVFRNPETTYTVLRLAPDRPLRVIGPSLAAAIVAKFQEQTFDVIEHEPERLLQVPGIGPNRIQIIREVWHEQSAVRNLMAYLQAQNLPPTLAIKIYRALGPAAP